MTIENMIDFCSAKNLSLADYTTRNKYFVITFLTNILEMSIYEKDQSLSISAVYLCI